MELNFAQMSSMNETFEALKDKQMPFKLSLIIAKDMALLSKEIDFYVEQERTFAQKYLQVDENGQFVQDSPGVFKIIEGKEEECATAREELNKFTTNVELRTIPISLIENMEFTPAQLAALEMLIEEE